MAARAATRGSRRQESHWSRDALSQPEPSGPLTKLRSSKALQGLQRLRLRMLWLRQARLRSPSRWPRAVCSIISSRRAYWAPTSGQSLWGLPRPVPRATPLWVLRREFRRGQPRPTTKIFEGFKIVSAPTSRTPNPAGQKPRPGSSEERLPRTRPPAAPPFRRAATSPERTPQPHRPNSGLLT